MPDDLGDGDPVGEPFGSADGGIDRTPEQVAADYDAIKEASNKFFQEEDRIYELLNTMRNQADGLQGVWVGQGAKQFQQEMQNSIYPAFKRLHRALHEAGTVCIYIVNIFQKAEQEAADMVTIHVMEAYSADGP